MLVSSFFLLWDHQEQGCSSAQRLRVSSEADFWACGESTHWMTLGKVSTGKVQSSICLPLEGCTTGGVYQQRALCKHLGGLATYGKGIGAGRMAGYR